MCQILLGFANVTIVLAKCLMMASGSRDSNLNGPAKPTATAEASSCIETSLKWSSDDAGWNYGTLCDPTNKDATKCNLCGFMCRAEITRLKYHMTGIKWKGVAKCKKASKEDKDVYVMLLEKPKEKKV
ncbi:Zinc finger, BED-type predicted [Cynara cardunculus var. scolymus]|uniref:Zinc finger, BED-type predicted n=1 Tax=Cynara cardunculus var. scolymus TaxID=59895 RepID=A0A103XBL5_CYNCS|nr:Zinc finger, BED-type predicted [Cynara cardunculus var. scolymus]